MNFPAAALDRLARSVLDGDVVFFIGAGFSIDSEGNTAPRLMQRLLIRLFVMTKILGRPGMKIREDLEHTFELRLSPSAKCASDSCPAQPTELAKGFPYTRQHVASMATRYYETNDWFCGAFVQLLALGEQRIRSTSTNLLKRRAARRRLRDQIHRAEEEVRQSFEKKYLDSVPFDAFDFDLFELGFDHHQQHRRDAGKILFLDTMGFRHPEIMGGCPDEGAKWRDIETSYQGRLFPRHHVLARLAREGLCPNLITTNYDLLLEGAFRLAGFPEKMKPYDFPPTLINDFSTLASPGDFFTKGKAYRTAVVVKMHGCTRRYRSFKIKSSELGSYIQSMVFTYREIQNWRGDSWAADYLRTLLRTRTVVFCGYSLQDPVIHDTFRTVYEEMARLSNSAKKTDGPEKGPAFFFVPDGDKKREFHGMEVLQAASRAVGARRAGLGDHPNYIRFRFRHEKQFPHVDELFRWLFHLILRRRQEECLETDLRRISALLLGQSCPETQLEAVRKAFRDHLNGETRLRAVGRVTNAAASSITSFVAGRTSSTLACYASLPAARSCAVGKDRVWSSI
jgi:hypothetical protein